MGSQMVAHFSNRLTDPWNCLSHLGNQWKLSDLWAETFCSSDVFKKQKSTPYLRSWIYHPGMYPHAIIQMVSLHLLCNSHSIKGVAKHIIMNRFLLKITLISFGFCSCAKLGSTDTAKPKEDESPFGPTGIPPQLRAKSSTPTATAIVAGGNVSPNPLPLNITPEEDIVYTDPDNPEAGLPQLATLLSAPKRGPWEQSETVAKQFSMREGKPLLIWFTDSSNSPMCNALSQELFSTHEFGTWATEKIVRLKVDSNEKVTDAGLDIGSTYDREIRIKHYTTELKKRYKVLGYPSLIMLNSSGEVIGKYRGFKRGGAQHLWGQLKHAEAVSAESYKGWKAGLEKKGYREWQDRKNRKIFAKLTSYSKGTLMFLEPDGTKSQTKEEGLSDKDRSWIAEQKKLRNL
jgi:Thioredoxin-like domain